MSTLIYIHGFNSSPQSHKAGLLRQWLAQYRPDIDFITPDLNVFPKQAIQLLAQLVQQYPQAGLLGSSLGGFYATWLNQHYGNKAVLINPAVKAYDLLSTMLGEQRNYHTGKGYILTQAQVDELLAIEVDALMYPQRLWVLLQTADETLDYRLALAKYPQSPMLVEQGGNHAFDSFEHHIPAIIDFLDL
ncbi:MAG: esterase YqiA [Moraxellaceae bacterium]|nr:esterase [Pseudomonadales bacterium]MCP5176770.1 esterase YqiA [Moraxellaceae bacterium]